MVYRGLPSDGCKECRKSKKRCDLQWPVCARCVRLGRSCSGCRIPSTPPDEMHFLLYDAKSALGAKDWPRSLDSHHGTGANAAGKDDRTPPATCTLTFIVEKGSYIAPEEAADDQALVQSPGSTAPSIPSHNTSPATLLPTTSLKPHPDELAINYFLTQFTSLEPGLWTFLRHYTLLSHSGHSNECLDLVMRACGMAAFAGVNHVHHGAAYARSLYVEALGLLNPALGDPERRGKDEVLVAVRLLGVYESLMSGEQESFRSWKVHVDGVSQLLRLRGKDQLNSAMGRLLFREIEGEILVKCIWDELEPPQFILDWEDSLETMSVELGIAQPTDSITKISFAFANLRAKIRSNAISDHSAFEEAVALNARVTLWSRSVIELDPAWNWSVVHVPDSPHAWKGIVHHYNAGYIWGVWMAARGIRILILKTKDFLRRKIQLAAIDQAAHAESIRRELRQITDDICAAVPYMLHHDASTGKPSCTLISACNTIWSLYLSGIWAVQRRCGAEDWKNEAGNMPSSDLPHSSASLAQAVWIIGRLEYIATHFGLQWAHYAAGTLKSELEMKRTTLPEQARRYFFATRSLKREVAGYIR